ncbi:DUF6701 domain-containing protein [Aquabacterium sp. OR-4]|uniref:DUF6701 domain-containing protein n=1 Tax=Aquabacterium sp. OR-4 TaxID=2978127 RepID=UPI0021B3B8EF|nr:DUF6701 domain-containing protein [Aquabacterium sp. OR-4]MDT7836888.1 LamG-like jellyroll fold domain-containing protein [Aquabacterium sp. OR-4]
MHRLLHALALLCALLGSLLPAPAFSAIQFVSASSGRNDWIPNGGLPGALTIARPANVRPGMALVASIAARPQAMTVVVPAGWVQMTFTNQSNGGSATPPYGMTLVTYYKIATPSEPASYTWTFANPSGYGGAAAGGILAYNGIDTAGGTPIDNNGTAWSATTDGHSLSHGTSGITTVSADTLVIASIAYLSAGTFGPPSGISGLTQRLQQSAPNYANSVGVTVQMSSVPMPAAGPVGGVSATAAADPDHGVGHLMALKASLIDPSVTLTRSGPLMPGGNGSYAIRVTNDGLQTEPGPLTVIDTLPAGLAYSSHSGSGWSCNRAGQVLTCTRSGALAPGASAPDLTLNVSVNTGASGTLSNTVTVSGTGGDSNVQNNTAVNHYAVPTPPWAWWALDETSWGVVADASGNARPATGLGTAAPTGTTVPSPPGQAVAGNPGTCGAASIPAASSATGIHTLVNPNTLGQAGTLAFWYAGSSTWNDGNSRMLFDASLDSVLGDRHFFLAKDGNGQLVFSLQDSAGATATATSSSYGYPANEWHHITVSWNLATGTLAVYVDGTLAASASGGLNGQLGTLATLYVGSQRMANVGGTPAAYGSNSANGYIDELRLYNSALSALEIESLPALSHACSIGIDHYEINLPSSAVSCLASTVTITACSNASSPCTAPAGTLNGRSVTLLAAGGTLASSSLVFDASGRVSTALSHPAAVDGAVGTVTLLLPDVLPANATQCCPNGSSCSASSSCTITYSTAGFVIAAASGGAATPVATQTAGVAASHVLRAVRTNTSTQACEAALTGSQSVNWAYQCNNPALCSSGNRLTVSGSSAVAVAGNAAPTWLDSTAVPMHFDANGNAPFSIALADVGQITLQASKAAGGTLAAPLSGSSNAFVVRPAGFAVSGVKCTLYAAGECATASLASPGHNPGAADAGGSAFMPAGKAFSATVTAVDTAGNALPAYGRELPPEGVKLAATLLQPAGGAAPALLNGGLFGVFTNGAATASALIYPEVGVIALTPSVADGSYLGTGDVLGAASGPVGRFTPHHFAISATPACGASFSYAGQPFAVSLTARNGLAVPATTVNYAHHASAAARFARAVGFSEGLALGLGSFAGSGVPASGFAGGVGSGSASYSFSSKTTAPQLLTVRATDADGVSSAGGVEPAMLLRSGRLRLSNAFGSAKTSLQVPLSLDYWSGLAWLVSADDSCTTLSPAHVALSNPRDARGAASAAGTTVSAVALVAGRGMLTLSAPTPAGHSLTVDLALNLGSTGSDQSCQASHPASTGAAQPWLRSANGACAATADRDPAGRASFGIYSPESRKAVHVREMF